MKAHVEWGHEVTSPIMDKPQGQPWDPEITHLFSVRGLHVRCFLFQSLRLPLTARLLPWGYVRLVNRCFGNSLHNNKH